MTAAQMQHLDTSIPNTDYVANTTTLSVSRYAAWPVSVKAGEGLLGCKHAPHTKCLISDSLTQQVLVHG